MQSKTKTSAPAETLNTPTLSQGLGRCELGSCPLKQRVK